MAGHVLLIEQLAFTGIWAVGSGQDLREESRGIQPGDRLSIEEVDSSGQRTGRMMIATVTCIAIRLAERFPDAGLEGSVLIWFNVQHRIGAGEVVGGSGGPRG